MKNGLGNLSKALKRLAWICCVLLMLFTLFGVFFRQHGVSRKEFDYANGVYAVCGVALVLAGYIASRRWNAVVHDRRWIALGCVALFVFQRFVTHQAIFGTGWDAVDVVNFAWRIATGGECSDWENLYLSNYTNNAWLILLYSVLIRIRMLFGAELVRRDVLLALTIVNSVAASAGAYLVYRCTRILAREKRTALLAWLAYCALIGLSPWFLIPYSDALALFIPILILYIYLNGRIRKGKWILIGALSYMGFQFKPAATVVPIAIVIREILLVMETGRYRALLRAMAAALAACVVLHTGFLELPMDRIGWKIDREKRLSIPHYLMMGLNSENMGIYLGSDVTYSSSFATREERTKANLEMAKKRLHDMGAGGYLSFLANKSAVNFHDGTFGWGQEGGFMRVVFDVEQTRVNRMLKSIYFPDGDRHHHLMNLLQVFWLGVLIGQTASLLSRRAKENGLSLLHLCVAGVTLFTLLFEARARYLYVFAPVMIVAACIGYEALWSRVFRFFGKTRGETVKK